MGYSAFFGEDVSSERVQRILAEQYEPGREYGSYKVNCACCKRDFFSMRPEAKYCSYRCTNDSYIAKRAERRKQDRVKSCACCGEIFEAKRKDAKFCSIACKQKSYRVRVSSNGATDNRNGNIKEDVTDTG